MNHSIDDLGEEALRLGATHAVRIDARSIDYSQDFRRLCEENKCGQYGTNWMCPPAVGTFEELQRKVKCYSDGLLFQTVHQLSNSLDWKGMKEAFRVHDAVLRRIIDHMSTCYDAKEILALGAGPCTTCDKCSAPDGEPCRFPNLAVASCESYGIDVARLVGHYGIPYHHGKNTVSYVGCILFTPP